MESPDEVSHIVSQEAHRITNNPLLIEDYEQLREEVMANFQKPNLPNINVPEKIIICLDLCYDAQNSLFRLADGTTYTPIDMLKRVLDFFLHSKHAINKKTEFALFVVNEIEVHFVLNFTSNVKDVINAIDYIQPEECTQETFDFQKIFDILKQNIEIPEYKQSECILPPPYVVRMIVLYNRSNCTPVFQQDDPYFSFLKKHLFFYIDILYTHEDDCALYKCEEIYDALQDLDDGYSFVFEVSKNATKIHDCVAKLLAHPLQRPLQKNTDYTFCTRQSYIL